MKLPMGGQLSALGGKNLTLVLLLKIQPYSGKIIMLLSQQPSIILHPIPMHYRG
jgi:hypothetical protein